MRSGRSRSRKNVALYVVCVLFSFGQGWLLMKGPHALGNYILYFGVAGALPFLLLNGVHGDAEGVAGVVGGIFYVLTSGAVYYGMVALIRRLLYGTHRK